MWSRASSDRRGVAALEFALVGGAFFLLLLGAMELGRYQATRQALRNQMAEALRQWQVQIGVAAGQAPGGIGAACGALAAPSAATVPLLVGGRITYSGQACTLVNGVTTLSLTVSYPYQFRAPLLPRAALTISERGALSF